MATAAAPHALVASLAVAAAAAVWRGTRDIPPGPRRLLAVAPFLAFYTALPIVVFRWLYPGHSTATVCQYAALLTWHGNLKLFAFAFGRGPLGACPRFTEFAVLGLLNLPVHAARRPKAPGAAATGLQALLPGACFRGLLLLCCALVVVYRPEARGWTALLVPLVYVQSGAANDVMALFATVVFGMEVEPCMAAPYYSTSLAEFWRRWNRPAAAALRWAVFDPIASGSLLHRPTAASAAAVPLWRHSAALLATFVVSGFFHEYMLWVSADLLSGEWLAFFIILGVLAVLEGMAGQLRRRLGLPAPPPLIGIAMVWTVQIGLARQLFYPSYIAAGWADVVADDLRPFLLTPNAP